MKRENWPNEPVLRFHKTSSNMPRVVWAEESKTALGFEIRPSYDDVPTTSQCATIWQSSCNVPLTEDQ